MTVHTDLHIAISRCLDPLRGGSDGRFSRRPAGHNRLAANRCSMCVAHDALDQLTVTRRKCNLAQFAALLFNRSIRVNKRNLSRHVSARGLIDQPTGDRVRPDQKHTGSSGQILLGSIGVQTVVGPDLLVPAWDGNIGRGVQPILGYVFRHDTGRGGYTGHPTIIGHSGHHTRMLTLRRRHRHHAPGLRYPDRCGLRCHNRCRLRAAANSQTAAIRTGVTLAQG